MSDLIKSLLALEKIKRPEVQAYIVYTYLLNKDGGPFGYFIPLRVCSSEEQAEEKAKEIMELTGHGSVFTYPMGRWISLGDPDQVKVIPIHDELKEYADKEKKYQDELRHERERIQEDIKKEQAAIIQADTLESYYYDWVCAVQNKAHVDAMRKEVSAVEEAYKKRIKSLQEKQEKFPTFKEDWEKVFLERLTARGEKDQAEAIIRFSKEIALQENL
jgi:uncharacterized protein YhaN